MSIDGFQERGQALENQFFQQKDKQLLEKLQKDLASKEARDALSAASGIDDHEVLGLMLENNIDANTIAAVSLVPLIVVAWADSKMDAAEKDALLKAAAESGISENSPSYMLLQSWTEKKPDASLFESWKQYVGSLTEAMDDASIEKVKSTVMSRVRQVASAAGGFLGIGSTSSVEAAVIDECEKSFG